MFRALRAVPRWWLPSAGAAIGAAIVCVVLVVGERLGPHPPVGGDTQPEPLRRSDGAIHLAGTGTALPLARALAAAFDGRHGELAAVVHDSIGSTGGRRAVEDDVIDIGLVSLPEGDTQTMECCTVHPVALAAVVFAAHQSVPVRSISQQDVLDIFSGRMHRWPDGQLVVPLLREQRDSSTRVAGQVIPGFVGLVRAARVGGRWPTLITDAEMGRALTATPGGVGLFDLGTIALEEMPVRALSFDGVAPSFDNLRARRYPLRRVLAMVVKRDASQAVREFLDFVRSSDGRQVIEAGGSYVALSGGRR